MKIKRIINGREETIELTNDELWGAHDEAEIEDIYGFIIGETDSDDVAKITECAKKIHRAIQDDNNLAQMYDEALAYNVEKYLTKYGLIEG